MPKNPNPNLKTRKVSIYLQIHIMRTKLKFVSHKSQIISQISNQYLLSLLSFNYPFVLTPKLKFQKSMSTLSRTKYQPSALHVPPGRHLPILIGRGRPPIARSVRPLTPECQTPLTLPLKSTQNYPRAPSTSPNQVHKIKHPFQNSSFFFSKLQPDS